MQRDLQKLNMAAVLSGSQPRGLALPDARHVESSSKIGPRQYQEDRIVICPDLGAKTSSNRDSAYSLMGLFDGTVGDSVSDFCSRNFVSHLQAEEDFIACLRANGLRSYNISLKEIEATERALRNAFHNLDEAFFRSVGRDIDLDYTCSTGLVALLWGSFLTVAHVGDSRCLRCRVTGEGELETSWLTKDHKPHHDIEKKRILENGGNVVWLRGSQPYLRGGDFFQRHTLGHKPKQLNYSRAFGGKGLKKYGLSVDPDVKTFMLTPDDR